MSDPMQQPIPFPCNDQSPSLGKLADALAKAQGEMGGAKKDASNPYFKSMYADLASVREAIRLPLAKNGLAFVQQVATKMINGGLGEVTVTTTLVHSSGEFIKDRCTLPVLPMPRRAKDGTESQPQGPAVITPQAFGSAITYARRYSLSAMVGIAAEDDDGNAASQAFQDTMNGHATGEKRVQPAASAKRAEVKEALKAQLGTPDAKDVVDPVLPLGKSKGKRVSEADTDDLEWVKQALESALDNPEKARFKASNESLLASVNTELERRAG